jgi:hypothetical protein
LSVVSHANAAWLLHSSSALELWMAAVRVRVVSVL